MLNGATVLTRFTADTKDFDKGANNISDGLEELQRKGKIAFAAMTTAVNAFALSIAKTGIEYNAQIETYLTRLTTLTGDATKAEQILEQIKQDALATPFEVSSLTQAESLLLATGLSAEQARGDILALGDAISASGGGNEELQRMAVNLQQIKNVGKATALDIRQFAFAGINIYGLLADSLGVTTEEVKEMDISYEMLSKALQDASREGGKYYKAMEKQSTTYKGAMSNLKESVDVFAGAMAEGLFNALKDVIPPLTDLFNWLTKNKDLVLALVIPFLTFINVFTGFLLINKVIGLFKALWAVMMANPIALIVAAIAGLVLGFIYLWNNCEAFRDFWIGLWNGIVSFVQEAIDWIVSIFNTIIDFISNNWQSLLLFLVNPFAGAFKLLYDNCESFRNFVNNFINTIVSWFKTIPGKLKSVADGIINVFKSLPTKMMNIGKEMINGLVKGVKNAKDMAINAVKNLGSKILKGIKGILGIHSPSTAFSFVAKMSVLGFTEGLDKMQGEVQKQLAETFNVNPQLSASTGMHYSPNVNVVNNVDIKQDPLGQMVNSIKTYSGGAKNDYNYGAGS